jgi:hypothetical protein
MTKSKTYSGAASLTAAKKAGLNVKKATGYAASEKVNPKKDKKAGLKMRGGGCVSRMK